MTKRKDEYADDICKCGEKRSKHIYNYGCHYGTLRCTRYEWKGLT